MKKLKVGPKICANTVIGFAFTVEKHRGKGLIGAVCTDLARKVHEIQLIPFATILVNNQSSLRAFTEKLRWPKSKLLWKFALLYFNH